MSTEETQHTTKTEAEAERSLAANTPDSCSRCESPLQRTTQFGSRNRATTLYCCPDCGFSAVAATRQDGALSELAKTSLQDRRDAIVHGLSAYRLAAFISEGCPAGEYRVERKSEHTYQIQLPEQTTQSQLGPLADRISAAASHLMVQELPEVPALNVKDTRLSDVVDQPTSTDGGTTIATPSAGGPQALPPVLSDDDPRTKRAKREEMDVTLLEKGGRYEVHSQSGRIYEVDILAETCSCPDDHDYCKHRRRVEIAIDCHRVPRPDGRLPNWK